MHQDQDKDYVEVKLLLTRQAWAIAQRLATGKHPKSAALLGEWNETMSAEDLLGMLLEIQLKEQMGEA